MANQKSKTKSAAAVRSSDLLAALEQYVRQSKLDKKFDAAPSVAILAGPAVCIEIIVRKAEKESGIEMDWGYVGGRAIVHALGDRKKARSALYAAFPQGDLDQHDMCG